ncbi:MAG TPA: response regulator [Pyrinomonadaceae bacterium]|nr:response regulator [Pyrinomonadaceae bacterium]
MSPLDNTPLPEPDAKLSPTESDGQLCVLLAEDDRALRRFLEVTLARAGYRVLPASDGLEAMKLVMSNRIDVVITDAIMPNLSGHEFCRFLKSTPSLSQLPIILLSALEGQDGPQSRELVDAFLAKPIAGETLIECIEKLTAGKN